MFCARVCSQATRKSVATTLSTLILSYTITQASTSPMIEAFTVHANEFVLGVDGTRTELCPRQGREKHFFSRRWSLHMPFQGRWRPPRRGRGGAPDTFILWSTSRLPSPRQGRGLCACCCAWRTTRCRRGWAAAAGREPPRPRPLRAWMLPPKEKNREDEHE